MEPYPFGSILEPWNAFSKSPKPFDILMAFRRYNGANTPSGILEPGGVFSKSAEPFDILMAFRWYDGANTPGAILVSTRQKSRDQPSSYIRSPPPPSTMLPASSLTAWRLYASWQYYC